MTDDVLKLDVEDIVRLVQNHFVEERGRLISENFSEDFSDKVMKNCIEFTIVFYTSTNSLIFPIIYKENMGQVNVIYMYGEKYFQFEITSAEKPNVYSANMHGAVNSDGKLVAGGKRNSLVAFSHYMNRHDLSFGERKIWVH
jgi:hypothetical protein